MEKVDPDTMQDFLLWLGSHEDDIQYGINDFGELRELFHQLFDRNAGEPCNDTPLW